MSGAPSRRELFDELSAFNRKLRAAFDSLVREHGMTLARARVFHKLSKRDGINQRELADELELETPDFGAYPRRHGGAELHRAPCGAVGSTRQANIH